MHMYAHAHVCMCDGIYACLLADMLWNVCVCYICLHMCICLYVCLCMCVSIQPEAPPIDLLELSTVPRKSEPPRPSAATLFPSDCRMTPTPTAFLSSGRFKGFVEGEWTSDRKLPSLQLLRRLLEYGFWEVEGRKIMDGWCGWIDKWTVDGWMGGWACGWVCGWADG